MNSRTKILSELKPAAIKLRKKGRTFTEIQVELGAIPKGTLSGWLRNIEITESQKKRIKKLMFTKGMHGRQKGAWANHEKRIKRLAAIKEHASAEYSLLLKDPLFTTGLVLYLAEGSKKTESFQFMNSDPYLIKLMIQWIMVVSTIDFASLRFRLYIHDLYSNENCETYWVKTLGAEPGQFLKTVYKPTGREYKKNPAYKGCLRIEVKGGSELYWKTMAWRDCLYETIK